MFDIEVKSNKNIVFEIPEELKCKNGEKINIEGNIINGTNRDLTVSDYRCGCGCSDPFVSDRNIKANESVKYKIEFNSSGRRGFNSKSCYINVFNGTDSVEIKITFKVTVS